LALASASFNAAESGMVGMSDIAAI
jgi:hypothetical protein